MDNVAQICSEIFLKVAQFSTGINKQFGAGCHPTETPQLFYPVRRNPQEFEIVRTA